MLYYNNLYISLLILFLYYIEYYSNSSPGLCIHEVLKKLILQYQGKEFQLLFFYRDDSANTIFEKEMRELSYQSIKINQNDLIESRNIIANSMLDILIYLALPTEKFTFLLSQSRLVKIQVVFGIGHPLSSGSKAIDYSIISDLMSPFRYSQILNNKKSLLIKKGKELSAIECAKLVYTCVSENQNILLKNSLSDINDDKLLYNINNNIVTHFASSSKLNKSSFFLPNECFGSDIDGFSFTEQVVVFDTLGYFLYDSTNIYKEMHHEIFNKLSLLSNYRSPDKYLNNSIENIPIDFFCDDIDVILKNHGIYPNISARGIGCYEKKNTNKATSKSVHNNILIKHYRQYHIYGCLQHVKKFHPSFDKVFIGIMKLDPNAKILLLDQSRHIIPRILSNYPEISSDMLYDTFVFLPRLQHHHYLSVLSFISIFLNPFPFGSGVTSSDSISMCVPVIVSISKTSVLHFAASQISMLGVDMQKLLIVNNIDDYIQRSYDIVYGKFIKLNDLKDLICNRKLERLMNEKVLNEVVEEWKSFLIKIK